MGGGIVHDGSADSLRRGKPPPGGRAEFCGGHVRGGVRVWGRLRAGIRGAQGDPDS